MNSLATVDEQARRIALQSAIAARSDALLHADDRIPHLDSHERYVALSAALGDLAGCLWNNGGVDCEAALVEVGAWVGIWLEILAREASL